MFCVASLIPEIAKVTRLRFVLVQNEASNKSARVWKMFCEGLGGFTRPDNMAVPPAEGIESNSKNASLGGFLHAGHHGVEGH